MAMTLRSFGFAIMVALLLALLLITRLHAVQAAAHVVSAQPALADSCQSGIGHC
ncbi:MAG TPA: hypothetical protein VF808_20270 [Ktedonobacterales bacterium]